MTAHEPGTSQPAQTGTRAALENLDAALDPADYATTLTTRPGHRLCLSVTSRRAAIGDDIWADHR